MSVSCRKAGLPPAGICGAIRHPPAGPRPRLRQSTRHRAAQRHQGVSHTLCVCVCVRERERERQALTDLKWRKAREIDFARALALLLEKWLFSASLCPPPIKKKFLRALWFILEILMAKNENNSHAFIRKMVENIKQTKDGQCPDDPKINEVSAFFKNWFIYSFFKFLSSSFLTSPDWLTIRSLRLHVMMLLPHNTFFSFPFFFFFKPYPC